MEHNTRSFSWLITLIKTLINQKELYEEEPYRETDKPPAVEEIPALLWKPVFNDCAK